MFNFLVNVIPHVPLSKGVTGAVSGNPIFDTLPLLTLAATLPTLFLFFKKGKVVDVIVYGIGFTLAAIYHIVHLGAFGGIGGSTLWGLPGSLWRSLDIFVAQSLLSRSLGHAIGVHTSLLSVLCNALYPGILMTWSYLHNTDTGTPPLTFGSANKSLLLVMLAALAAKFAVEGASTLPAYCRHRGKKAVACFILAFVIFPLPEIWPGIYNIAHSLWHVFLGLGYYTLYTELLEGPGGKKAGNKAGKKKVELRVKAM